MFAENAPGGERSQWMCVTAPNFNPCGLTTNKKLDESEKVRPKIEVPDGYYGASAAAAYIGVTLKHIQYQFAKGRIKATRFGRNWFYSQEELDAFRFGT